MYKPSTFFPKFRATSGYFTLRETVFKMNEKRHSWCFKNGIDKNQRTIKTIDKRKMKDIQCNWSNKRQLVYILLKILLEILWCEPKNSCTKRLIAIHHNWPRKFKFRVTFEIPVHKISKWTYFVDLQFSFIYWIDVYSHMIWAVSTMWKERKNWDFRVKCPLSTTTFWFHFQFDFQLENTKKKKFKIKLLRSACQLQKPSWNAWKKNRSKKVEHVCFDVGPSTSLN